MAQASSSDFSKRVPPELRLAQSPEFACAQPQYESPSPRSGSAERAHAAAAAGGAIQLGVEAPATFPVSRAQIPPSEREHKGLVVNPLRAARQIAFQIPDGLRLGTISLDDQAIRKIIRMGQDLGFSSAQILSAFSGLEHVQEVRIATPSKIVKDQKGGKGRLEGFVTDTEIQQLFAALRKSPSWTKIHTVTIMRQPLTETLDLTGATALTTLHLMYCKQLEKPCVVTGCSELELILMDGPFRTPPVLSDCTKLKTAQFWNCKFTKAPDLTAARETLENYLLTGCSRLTGYLELENFEKLTHVFLDGCRKLQGVLIEGCDSLKHVGHDSHVNVSRNEQPPKKKQKGEKQQQAAAAMD